MKQSATSYLEIDLNRLAHNLKVIRQTIDADTSICAVIKADAYGLGAAPIASRLQQLGVETMAVFTPDQARELIGAGVNGRFLIFMPVRHLDRHDVLYRAMISGRLHFVVHDLEHLKQLIRIADTFGCILPLHVEVDTGMSRGGMTPEEASRVVGHILNHRRLHLAGLFTHFACADSESDTTHRQFDQFALLAQEFDEDLLQTTAFHAANTDATFAYGQRFHLDMVRIGLGWIGYPSGSSSSTADDVDTPDLQPIVRWVSSIAHIKWIDAGTPIGYGQTFVASRRTRVGLIPVGYADGFPTQLSNSGMVRLDASTQDTRKKSPLLPAASRLVDNTPSIQPALRLAGTDHHGIWSAPVIGRVSMDQFTVDLTDIPEDVAQVGSSVELLSQDPDASNNLINLAKSINLIPYEILCGISGRIPRRYLHRHSATPDVMWQSQQQRRAIAQRS